MVSTAALAAMLLISACGSPKSEEVKGPATEASKTEFSIGWSIYADWMPWAYAEKAGNLKRWGDKYGIKINLVQVND